MPLFRCCHASVQNQVLTPRKDTEDTDFSKISSEEISDDEGFVMTDSRHRPIIFHDATTTGVLDHIASDNQYFFDACEGDREWEEDPTTTSWITPRQQLSFHEANALLRPATERPEQPITTRDVYQEQKQPRFHVGERGYRGELTATERSECLAFYSKLKDTGGSLVHDIVYSFSDIEEEVYTLCRFLRANKFQAAKTLSRLNKAAAIWELAQVANFYPDLQAAIGGAPVGAFQAMYPFLYTGNARNGCPVSYLQAGKINTEGILCLTTVEQTPGFFWHQYMHVFKPSIVKAKRKDPTFMLCEGINVVDLKGMSSSQLNSEAMDVIHHLSSISDLFPETLHCMLILNAPSWFSIAWRMIVSKCIDARTARTIEVYSSEAEGQERLLQLVHKSEIPSDFGGDAPATGVAIAKQCQARGNTMKRQIVELLQVKRGDRGVSCQLNLERGERTNVKVFTRSSNSANFCVSSPDNGIRQERIHSVTHPRPCDTTLGSQLHGPGTFQVTASDLQPENGGKKMAVAYFLVVAEIFEA